MDNIDCELKLNTASETSNVAIYVCDFDISNFVLGIFVKVSRGVCSVQIDVAAGGSAGQDVGQYFALP